MAIQHREQITVMHAEVLMNQKEWKIPTYSDEINCAFADAGYTTLLAAVLQARGIDTPEKARDFLQHSEDFAYDPMLLEDMDKAVKRVELAIEKGEKVAVYGDYDVDGITSSCLLVDYLRSRGLECVVYIPDRIVEGYGVNEKAIEALHQDGSDLIITVDCGITAVLETEFAKSLGMDIIITDHHECPQFLPNAAAVIDPKRPDSKYPFEYLAGVGVAFKFVCALEKNLEGPLNRYADFVAVGTIADVMPLTGENRFLVHSGLDKLKNNPRQGFAALLEEAGTSKKPITATTVGFTLAPRINAAGRLCKTEISVELLLSENYEKASFYAKELCCLNRQRQELETKVWEDALTILSDDEKNKPIVLMSESWHPGVVGIAASRLTEEFKVPTIMICVDDESGKGSCRSYGDFNLFEALSACSEHLESFGGHAFAAGLNIKPQNIEAFRVALADYYHLNPPTWHPAIEPEIVIENPETLSMEGVLSLEAIEPCGCDNERPLMCMCDVTLENLTSIGNGKHLRMTVVKNKTRFDCVYFSHSFDSVDVRDGMTVDICFTPQINDFHAHRNVQLLINDIRPSETLTRCRSILEYEEIPVEELRIFRPEREELANVWRTIKQVGGRIELSYNELAEKRKISFMEPVKFCLCMKIFKELELIDFKTRNGRICCITCDNGAKTELNNSRLFRLLWDTGVRAAF